MVKTISTSLHVPYIRLDLSISHLLEFLDEYLRLRNANDIVIVLDKGKYIDQSLYHWVNSTRLRLVISFDQAEELKNIRPIPDNFVIVANTINMIKILKKINEDKLLYLPERWNLLFLDTNYEDFPKDLLQSGVNILRTENDFCCRLLNSESCYCPNDFNTEKTFLLRTIEYIQISLTKMAFNGNNLAGKVICYTKQYDEEIIRGFNNDFGKTIDDVKFFRENKGVYTLNIDATFERLNGSMIDNIAKYHSNQLVVEQGMNLKPSKTFYRVGITYSLPWIYQDTDPQTGKLYWTGFCVELVEHLSGRLNFDYELVVPQLGTFGRKDNTGKWDGLVGDLVRGETDMAVAPMVLRADREEVIDYVPPFFTQSGISIVMRKPVQETSLFEFVTVLKLEVWASILGVLVSTAFMVWFLDRYSPYSATNKKDVFNYNCREFNLQECFWFALTTFTPQGGGEPPKAISSRVMITAYWLFAALMLATFTANLAAFLTVSRMQVPIQSLEQLARQTRINYTVVNNSDIHKYFLKMKNAEDILHRMWKELALNASIDDYQYTVWDYPVREQYYSILLGINRAQPVPNASEGFRIVNERLNGDFAFIHDSSEIKYQVSRNCNLTEVGEVFAEKPYALVVQQGSHLTDLLSFAVVDLIVNSVFADLQAKYWNGSARGKCMDDDSEGISLESLGGVFIATVFGLVLALFIMAGEVFLLKRDANKAGTFNNNINEHAIVKKEHAKKIVVYPDTVTIGTIFKPISENKLTPKISRLSVRSRNRLPQDN